MDGIEKKSASSSKSRSSNIPNMIYCVEAPYPAFLVRSQVKIEYIVHKLHHWEILDKGSQGYFF